MTFRILASILLSLTIFVSGCGGRAAQSAPSTTQAAIIAADVFSNKAETWEYISHCRNLNSDGSRGPYVEAHTSIQVIPVDADHTIWRYAKDEPCAYWMEDGISATIDFFLERDSSGAWYSTGGHIVAPFGFPWDATHTPQDFTYTTVGIQGHPRPYLILADSGITDDTVFPDITAETRWKTMTYTENGMLVSEQWEGPCIHEKWYFAIGRGLVKVIPFDNGGCSTLDPLETMERVN